MRDPPGESAGRAEALRARPDGLLGARAQRKRRAGDRAQESRLGPAYLLRADPRPGHRAHAVPVDPAELSLRLPARLHRGNVYPDAAEPGKPVVTLLKLLLRDEIARGGPISFHRFMEVALYHPEHGYYRRASRDPFGREGDFFTAEQVQPVFGLLIATRIRALFREMGEPADF